MKTLKVHVEYTKELLGTLPADTDIYTNFIADKAPDAETREQQIAMMGAAEYTDKSMTVFARNSVGWPINLAYQWKGYFKDACSMLRRVDGYKSKKLTAFKKIIDGLIFVYPDEIPLLLPHNGEIGSVLVIFGICRHEFCRRVFLQLSRGGHPLSRHKKSAATGSVRLCFRITRNRAGWLMFRGFLAVYQFSVCTRIS